MPGDTSCPTCKRTGPWLGNPTSPFCSERCRLVDLGKWLGEEHRISSPLTEEALEELEESDVEKQPRT